MKKRNCSVWAVLLLALVLLAAGVCLYRHRNTISDGVFRLREKLREKRLRRQEYDDFADVSR